MKIKRDKKNIGKVRPKAQKTVKNHQFTTKFSPKKRKKGEKGRKRTKKGKRDAPRRKNEIRDPGRDLWERKKCGCWDVGVGR